jgi:MFS family permease
MLFPTCMGIEITSGFDSQMINAAQIVPSWKVFFNNPTGALQGIIGSMYSLGAICSLPLVPIINDRLGRRWAIFIGSWSKLTPLPRILIGRPFTNNLKS